MKNQVISYLFLKRIFTSLFLLFAVLSCQKGELELNPKQDSSNDNINEMSSDPIPYATITELTNFREDLDIVDYNLTRKLAILELSLDEFNSEMNWEDCTLSEFPVILYGFDSKPKFYEFMVLDLDGNAIGAVRTDARRKTGGVLHQVRENIPEYQKLRTKSGIGTKLIADYAGNLYGGFVGKSDESPTRITNLKSGKLQPEMVELSDEQILADLSVNLRARAQEALSAINSITDPTILERVAEVHPANVENQILELEMSMQAEHQQRDVYWAAVEANSQLLLATPDSEVPQVLGEIFAAETEEDPMVFLPEYKETQEVSLITDSKCPGPYAMAWIYYTKLEEDKENNKDGNYDYFLDFASPFGDSHIMFPWEMFTSMGEVSNWDIVVMPWFSFGRKSAYYHVQVEHSPIIILSDLGINWKVGYGVSRSTKNGWTDFYFATKDSKGYNVNDKAFWFFLFLEVHYSANIENNQ
ncbi:hypothetical protein [Marinifilum caeruleilacunae]|uniref:Spi protease inhibitor domain-containing protein n=1 Tax=Marinifilum caeruleilacunae TaxID=2499076 RepID=A0ABX1WU91_9BACT|nr:hypothetical protein [Marinifilum caeruleilacunae]NOU59494.1 hypothetical protein [Marinifilum caeruleilacunae]